VGDPVLKQTATLLGEGMTNRTEKALLELLAFPDMRVRQEAQFELAARGPKSFDGLRKVAFESKNRLARIHAIWGMGQIVRPMPSTQFVKEMEGLLPLLDSDDLEVQTQSIRLLGAARVVKAQEKLEQFIAHGQPRLAAASLLAFRDLQAALPRLDGRFLGLRDSYKPSIALRMLNRMLKPLVKALGHNPNPSVFSTVHMPIHLLESQFNAGSKLDPILIHNAVLLRLEVAKGNPRDYGSAHAGVEYETNSALRMVSLLCDRMLGNPGISLFLSDPDPLLVLEAARAINDVPITYALPALAELAEPAKLDALRQQFASLPTENLKLNTENLSGAIRDVRADQPLPWGDAPIDHLTPMLLRVVNANLRVGTPAAATRLAALAARTDLPVLIRTEALNALATWATPFPRDRIVGTYRPLPPRDPAPARAALEGSLRAIAAFQPPPELTPEQKASVERAQAADPAFQFLDTRFTTEVPAPVLSAAAETVAKLVPADGADFLFRLVASESPAPARTTALRCLAEMVTQGGTAPVRFHFAGRRVDVDNPGGDPEQSKKLWMLGNALQVAGDAQDESLRLEASRVRALLNPEDAAGQLAAKLTGGSLAEQRSAYAVLGDLKSDAADALLAEALDRLMKRDVANEVMLDLVLAASKRDAAAVKTRLAAYQDWKLPKDHLSPYREALFGGDAARGRKIFYENAAVACTRCHQIGGDGGGNAGPKLDGLSSRVTREHLLESVVFPNQQVVQGFETAMITLNDGQTYAGVVKSENDTELVVISPEEGDVTLKKASVQTREKGLSGMPEGFGSLLTPLELRDVVEFLGTLK
jgi:quinoprotein glucose dehydrogenase